MTAIAQKNIVSQFRKDVLKGLSDPVQKSLPSKYFYDEAGDALFVRISQMPEYYLTRAEMNIFKVKTQELIDSLGQLKTKRFQLVELGAGDGSKTTELLKGLLTEDYDFEYCPTDISQNALAGLTAMLSGVLPQLEVNPRQGDYFDILNEYRTNGLPKVVLFLGSTIGNQSDEQARKLMQRLGSALSTGDKLILGADLKKPSAIVLPAYNDDAGITREFNLNLLRRINRELGGDFNPDYFTHQPTYDETSGIALSYLRSSKRQRVYIAALDTAFVFEEGELIHMEISRKYDDGIIARITEGSNLAVTGKICDEAGLFADYILTRG